MSDEEWRPVVDFPLYQVSNQGRVRRHPDFPSCHPKESFLAAVDGRGYPSVMLRREGKPYRCRVHRLVCTAFHGAPPSALHEVAHQNGVRADVTADNLSWKTRRENCADKKRHGTHREGSEIPWARLSDEKVRLIKGRLASGESLSSIARSYDIAVGAIGNIKAGRNWKHVKDLEKAP